MKNTRFKGKGKNRSLVLLALAVVIVGASLSFTAFTERPIGNEKDGIDGVIVEFEPTSPPSESYYQNKTGSTANNLNVFIDLNVAELYSII